MKWKRRSLCGLLAFVFSISWIFNAQFAYAAETDISAPTEMWVEPSETNGIPAQIDGFKVRAGGTSFRPNYIYQFYLPGNVDPANCFLSWNGGMQATVDGKTYSSGNCPIPLPNTNTETTFTFKNGSQTVASLKVIAYQGSPSVQPVFIDIDETGGNPTIAQMDGDSTHETTCTGRINIAGQWYAMPKMKGRGNVTWDQADDKRPYNITLDKKINFPGIDSDATKKWTFLAEILDHSLLCNRSGFYLAHEIGVGQDTASADVWMNGEYQGCYTVTPKTDSYVTKNGFMIEEDNYKEPSIADGGDPQFTLVGLKEASGWPSCYNRITVKKMGDNLLLNDGVVDESPANMEAAASRIQTWLQDAWDAIRSDNGYNSKGKYYTDYIDIESFAKMYLMHEYVKSYDVCAGSLLFYRDGQTDNDKLIAGPLWDLDNAMGSVYQNASLGRADDRRNGDRRSGEGDFIPNVTEYKTSIYKTLSKHEDFMAEVYRQYNKHRASFDSLPNDVAQMINDIEASAKMNHIKVNEISHNNHKYSASTTFGSGQYLQNYLATTNSKTDWANYAANLKTFITTRSLWFRNNYYDPSYIDPATCEHAYEPVITAPTCTSEGIVTYTCPICGDSYTEPIQKIPHDYQEGVCTVCGEALLDVTISCDKGASVTVYETQDPEGAFMENATSTHPRNSDTGLIDCSGDGQVNFVVNIEPGYELESVTAAPTTAYKNLKLPADTGITNGYRLTKVKGDVTIMVKTYGYITFDANNGSGTMEAQKIYAGVETVLSENLFTRAGYTFTGWNTEPDGSGTAYVDKASVTLSGSTTLYAQWKSNTYAITFLDEDGTVLQSSEVANGETPNYTGETPTKTATEDNYYIFSGWTPTVVPAAADAIYTAVFTAVARTYSDPVWNWTGNGENGYTAATATFTTNDGQAEFTKVVDAELGSSTIDPTCEAPGKITYTASVTFKGNVYSDDMEVTIDELGHEWNEPTYSWSEDNSTVTATRVCVNDPKHIETETAETSYEVVQPAGEMTPGIGRYTSETFENEGFEIQTKDIELPPTGYKVTYTWSDDNRKVTGTAEPYAQGAETITETVNATYEVTKEATCTEEGAGVWTTEAFENSQFAVQTKEVTIEATGHNLTEHPEVRATCTEAGNSAYWSCDKCGKYFNDAAGTTAIEADSWVIEATGHNMTEHAAVDATCTEAGSSAYWSCDKCGKYFSDAEGTTAIEADSWVIEATGHNLTEHAAVDATCTEAGNSAYWSCDKCGKYFNDAEGTTAIEADSWVIDATGHNLTEHPEVRATCTEAGNSAYWSCDKCGKYFNDAEGTTAIEENSWVIPAKGHNWGAPTYSWSEDNSTVTATRVCANDPKHIETETAETSYEVVQPAEEMTPGIGRYTSEAFENEGFEVQTKDIELPPTGYKVTYTWSDDNSKVTGTAEPYAQGAETITETVNATYEVTKEATCTEEGAGVWTTEAFENSQFAVQTKEVTIEATGHTPVTDAAVEPTCTETGLTEGSHCSVCNEVLVAQEVIPAKGHTPVTDAAVEPTCTETGLTEGSHCSVCNEVLVAQEVIPAKGHTPVTDAAVEPTCTETGLTEGSHCSVCNEVLVAQEEIPAKGHNWGAPEWTWADDHSTASATFTCQNDDSHTETVENAEVTSTTVQPTPTEDGLITYTATVTGPDGKPYTDTTEVIIPTAGFNIIVTQPQNGSASADKETAQPGEEVTITVTPNEGYQLSKITYTTASGTPTDITRDKSFIMPASDVTVDVTFAQLSGGGGGIGGVTPVESNKITIEVPENGSLALSKDEAAKGDVVVITPTPDEGYETGDVTVTDKDGKEIPVQDNGDGTYSFTMPDSPVKVTADFEAKEHDCPSKKFQDSDPNAWYHESVDYVVEKGLMNGVAADKFAPNDTTTRAMLVTILYRLEGEPAVSAENSFDDVTDGQWYTDAVLWASANGIVKGYGNGKFGPMDDITREQFATIVYHYANSKGYDISKAADLSRYEDASSIGSWALDAMKWANAEGLITGRTATTLVPAGDATRAETAAILMRFIEGVK